MLTPGQKLYGITSPYVGHQLFLGEIEEVTYVRPHDNPQWPDAIVIRYANGEEEAQHPEYYKWETEETALAELGRLRKAIVSKLTGWIIQLNSSL